MSPEQVNEDKYNNKSDIWSLGWILYEAACLKPPFQAENYLSLAVKIKEGKFSKIPSHYSPELQNLIWSMLQTDIDERPSVIDLLKSSKTQYRISKVKIKDQKYLYKQKEIWLSKREKALEEREKQFEEKVQKFEEKLKKFEEREKSVFDLESKWKALVSDYIKVMLLNYSFYRQDIQMQQLRNNLIRHMDWHVICHTSLSSKHLKNLVILTRWVKIRILKIFDLLEEFVPKLNSNFC